MRLSKGSIEPGSVGPVRKASIKSAFNPAALKITILLLVLLCLVPSASARDYALEGAATNITIDPSGLVHVEESISYTFEGNYQEVFRILEVSPGESIRNIQGYCSEEACNFRVEQTSEGYELIGELPTPTPKEVTFFISYDHYGAVKVHSDVSEFHYKLWGEEWEKPLGSLEGSIKLPVENENEIQYWIHPTGYTQDASLEQNVLNLKTSEIPSNKWYEIRVVFPRIESPNSSLVQVDNEAGLEKIKSIENEYEMKGWILKGLYNLAIVFAVFALAFPFIIYFRYGREPKIDYEAIYEREPPTDSSPAVVNAIMKGNIGTPTMDGFTATVMNLANLGYITLHTVKSEESRALGLFKSESENILIELVSPDSSEIANGKLPKLADFEKDVFNLLKKHASENKVSWDKLKKELGKGTDFYQFVLAWNKKVEKHIVVEKLFRSTGNTYMGIFGVATIIAAVVYFVVISKYFPSESFPLASNVNILVALVVVFGIIMIIFSGMFEKVLGSWTPEGRLYYERWDNFRKYLTDFSALKEHPPESIKIWDSYLVYATALGVAEEVLKNMSLVVPDEQLKYSHFYYVQHSYSQFGSGFGSAYSASAPSSSGSGGGVGGVGGGSGGGGGGAR
ncbi:hypothetical protein EO95_06180 [Methanosarcina sp. 1.H.T.1A.1]|uniref:DUF2207 domain-containing protein n=1 Tax=Methanosarcina sp. 1.H.T.1A.1 TaxID=1483602 RepID=UPI0006219BA0|nr:DUF2207 domain-containing protein [Methanosarcina sp. 1.H.T.1A.1]KKH99448.1 hypothetical protein EO95_06180 [Methanosarcina sp. 1.H.T.1A.1]